MVMAANDGSAEKDIAMIAASARDAISLIVKP